jgi:hypothetical protein
VCPSGNADNREREREREREGERERQRDPMGAPTRIVPSAFAGSEARPAGNIGVRRARRENVCSYFY